MSAEQNTPVFEPGKKQPERPPTPEGKDLSPLVKQLDQAAGLANNGHIKELTHKNFPDLSPNELEEIRALGYTTRIGRLMFISARTTDEDVKQICAQQIARLTKLRDERFKKNYKRFAEPIEPEPVNLQKEKPKIPQQRNDDDGLGRLYL